MISLFAAAVLAATPQNITVTVDVKPGDTIAGVRHFRVLVGAVDPITQVEFYVGSELRSSDASIPYEFDLDSVEERDGKLDLTFAAYTSKGDSSKKVVAITIDNGVVLGLNAHIEKGVDFIRDSKWDDAILHGRIALKIEPASNHARMVMARAYLGKGALDKAQKYAEDWHQSEPNNIDASELLSSIAVHRAFFTVSRGEDRESALRSIQNAFKSAINTRQDVLQARLDKIGKPNSENILAYADAAIAARRYSAAINALSEEYHKHVDRSDVTNRLAFAQLQSGKVEDAYSTLNQVRRLSKLDAYGNALMSVILAISHDAKGSEKYMADSMRLDPNDLGARTGQAFIALRQNKADDLANVATGLIEDAGARPEVNYYLNALYGLRGNHGEGRKYFETMIYADPLSEAGYIEEGNNALLFAIRGAAKDRAFRAKSAKAMFETALEVRPESYRGLLGLAFASMLVGEAKDGVKYANAAVKVAPTQASTLYALSAALAQDGQAVEAHKYDRMAWKYDMTILNGRIVPKPIQAWAYYVQYDRIPVMSPPK
jgi:predicted Zn-dependent protease